jgi:hypothetical protein
MWGESSRTAEFHALCLGELPAGPRTDELSLELGQVIKKGQHQLPRA